MGRLTMMIDGEPVAFELAVPEGPAGIEDLLPLLRGLGDFFAARGAARAEACGRTVSCGPRCGACCRQLVPVSAHEARRMAALVAAMPEPGRGKVLARFAAAQARLDAAGLLAPMRAGDHDEVSAAYFGLGIACPFLEDESCSIHADRPMVCRQYLVTSPPAYCGDPHALPVERVALDVNPLRALLEGEGEGWVALVLALDLAANRPAPPPGRTGPELLAAMLEAFAAPADRADHASTGEAPAR